MSQSNLRVTDFITFKVFWLYTDIFSVPFCFAKKHVEVLRVQQVLCAKNRM